MKKTKTLIRTIFLLLSILFFFTSYTLNIQQSLLLSDIMKELGVVVLGIIMLETLWSAFGGDPQTEKLVGLENLISSQATSIENLVLSNTLRQSDIECGLARVHPRAKDVTHDELLNNLKNSFHHIDLQGITISDLVHNEEWLRIMKQRITSRVQIRIVVMSPENPSLLPGGKSAYREVELLRTQAAISWNKLATFYTQLSQDEKESVAFFRLENGIMSNSIRRFDSTMYIVHYLTHVDTRETPLYVIRGEDRPLFQKCMQEFQTNIDKNAYKLQA